MTWEELDKVRDKDHTVLKHIQNGDNDVQKLTEATTLENHHVTYAFEKLENLGLIQVEKPDGMVERVINGQKRVFQAPKQAEMTEKGEKYLDAEDPSEANRYEAMSHDDLVEKVHDLENQVEDLQKKFNVFRQQVKSQIQ